jgi:hypothetical protein
LAGLFCGCCVGDIGSPRHENRWLQQRAQAHDASRQQHAPGVLIVSSLAAARLPYSWAPCATAPRLPRRMTQGLCAVAGSRGFWQKRGERMHRRRACFGTTTSEAWTRIWARRVGFCTRQKGFPAGWPRVASGFGAVQLHGAVCCTKYRRAHKRNAVQLHGAVCGGAECRDALLLDSCNLHRSLNCSAGCVHAALRNLCVLRSRAAHASNAVLAAIFTEAR